jgi:hypothetical protein
MSSGSRLVLIVGVRLGWVRPLLGGPASPQLDLAFAGGTLLSRRAGPSGVRALAGNSPPI